MAQGQLKDKSKFSNTNVHIKYHIQFPRMTQCYYLACVLSFISSLPYLSPAHICTAITARLCLDHCINPVIMSNLFVCVSTLCMSSNFLLFDKFGIQLLRVWLR